MRDAARRSAHLLLVIALALAAGACATRPPESDPAALAAYEEKNDPLEPFNRTMWGMNRFLDRFIMRPVAWVYRTIFPKPIRSVVSNIYENANYPLVIVNAMLQGEFGRAGTATKRFLVNTTVGLGGMADPATAWGIDRIDEDFGQTLAVWGIGAEPYLVLPVIGPTNPRDTVGFVGDSLSDPVGLGLDIADKRWPRIGWQIGDVIETRDRNWQAIDEVYKSEDPYAFARSAFRQRREFLISNGAVTQSEEEEELFEMDFDDINGADGDGADDGIQTTAIPPHIPDLADRLLLGPGFTLRGGQ